MRKAYWIAQVTITNPESYAIYARGATEAFAKYGGRILARGGKVAALEGDAKARNVAIEFDNIEVALRCYHSKEYQSAQEFSRVGAGETQLMILEGTEANGADTEMLLPQHEEA